MQISHSLGSAMLAAMGLARPSVSEAALMARVGKDNHADSLRRKHVRTLDFTGKPMQGYVFVDVAGTKTDAQLRFWLDRCEQFVATLLPKAAK